MKKYPFYVDTRLPWSQPIPKHWKLLRNKFFLLEREEKSITGDETLLSLSQYTGVSIRDKDTEKTGMHKAESLIGYKAVFINDIVMNIMLAWNGSTAKSKYEGIISPAYAVYQVVNDTVNSDYLHYIFKTPQYMRYFETFSTGIIKSRLRLYPQSFLHLYTIIPPSDEQDQIVRFLDWKVSSINKLISIKRKQIALLHERQNVYISQIVTHGLHNGIVTKNSGEEWIGDIPEHWLAMRCKYLFSERDERSQDGTEQHLSMSQKYGLVPDSQLDERRMLSESYVGGKLCYKNDLVLNRLKAHLGVFALSPQSGVVSPDYTVLMPNTERILPSFAETVLKSDRCRGELCIRVRGIIEGFWRLYTDDFNTIVLPIPPLEEQAEIMECIAEFRDKAKKYEDTLTQQISNLQELKVRLISDAVTGKMDVRDIEIPKFEYIEETNLTEESDEQGYEDFKEEKE